MGWWAGRQAGKEAAGKALALRCCLEPLLLLLPLLGLFGRGWLGGQGLFLRRLQFLGSVDFVKDLLDFFGRGGGQVLEIFGKGGAIVEICFALL